MWPPTYPQAPAQPGALVGADAVGAACVDVVEGHPVAQAALGDPEVPGQLAYGLGTFSRELHGPLAELRWVGTGVTTPLDR